MAKAPTSLRIRTYNVGFGDCFLLSFRYPAGSDRHVLIDFGTTAYPLRRTTPKSLVEVAENIQSVCGDNLVMVVATHRHTDHISGFGGRSGQIITSLHPDLVVQPWTENPDLARDATTPAAAALAAAPAAGGGGGGGSRGLAARAAVARLDDMHHVAGLVANEARRLEKRRGVPQSLTDQLAFLGEENLKNEAAVRTLMALGKRRVYAKFGDKLPLGRILPGVKVDVLGPPTLAQSRAIRSEATKDPNEFWHLAATTARTAITGKSKPIFPKAAISTETPQEARWVIPKIERMNAEELHSLVRILDDAMNNTSLILLFEVGGKLLLFPGDAQIENWRWCLEGAPNAAAIRARLAAVSVYKVGHHGSLNATPKSLLWQHFERLNATDPADRMLTLLSTRNGKHGDLDASTEVPRRPLVTELETHTVLVDSRETPARQIFQDVELAF